MHSVNFSFCVYLECMHVCSDLRNIIQETFCFPKKALVSASSFILALMHKGSSPGCSVRLGRNLISYQGLIGSKVTVQLGRSGRLQASSLLSAGC